MKYKVGLTDRSPSRKGSKKRKPRKTTKSTRGKSFNMSGKRLSSSRSAARSRSRTKKRKPTSGYRKLGLFSRNKKRSVGNKRTISTKGVKKNAKAKDIFAKIFIYGLAISFFGGIILFFTAGLYLKSLQKSLPDPDRLLTWNPDQSTIIYDRNGKELFKIYGDENREFVAIEDIPEHTKWALLAAEDSEFYQHKGLDWKGIVRCSVQGLQGYLSTGSTAGMCGASTISQQLVRNTIMYEVYGAEAFERSNVYKAGRRKIREWLLTMQVEKVFTKDEILQMYMNEINLGGVNYGYQAAASSYFAKDVKDLTLAESALFAGIIQAPSQHSPLFGVAPEGGYERQEYVFNQMLKHSDLTGVTEEDIDAAREEELVYKAATIDIEAYHFVFYVKDHLVQQFGPEVVEKGGLRVYTTLDLSTQRIAEEELVNGIEKYGHPRNAHNGSMVVLDPKTNQILAMVGSVDPNENEDKRIDGSVNIATSERQMGSSFKPYVYLTAFQKYGPWLETADIEYTFGGYKPVNWDHKFMGLMNARLALVKSRNLPANYTMQLMGIENVLQNVEKMGVTTLKDKADYGLALALGAGEMKLLEHAQGFSVFATGGIKRDVTPILKVEDAQGEILAEYKDDGKRIFDEKDIYLVNWTICDLGGFGDQAGAKYYNIGGKRSLCGKTGTTNGPKDLVSIQYHKNLVVAVWTGNNNNDIMGPNAWSTNVPLPIVHSFMNRVADKYKPEMFTRPSGILATTVCSDTGKTPGSGTSCNKVSSIYVQGRAPGVDSRSAVRVCKDSGLKSTNEAIAESFGLLTTRFVLNYELENSLQQKTFNEHLKSLSSDSNIIATEPAEGACDLPLGEGNAPVVDITAPNAGTSYSGGDTVTITASAWAEGNIHSVQFYFNGTPIGTPDTAAPYTVDYTIPSGTAAGSYVLSATATDDVSRTGAATVAITVTSSVTVSITSPANGASVTIPTTLSADVSGMTASQVVFSITSSTNAGYGTKTYTDSNSSDGWSVSWNDVAATTGTYNITVTAIKGTGGSAVVVSGGSVTVNIP